MSETSKPGEPRMATGMTPRLEGLIGFTSLPGLMSMAMGTGRTMNSMGDVETVATTPPVTSCGREKFGIHVPSGSPPGLSAPRAVTTLPGPSKRQTRSGEIRKKLPCTPTVSPSTSMRFIGNCSGDELYRSTASRFR
jgi:hypothetical protein